MDHIKVLKDIIAIDTSVPPGNNYMRALAYLNPIFQEMGCNTEIIDIPPEHAEGRKGRMALICHRRQQAKPRLIIYAHIDVVPAQGWDAFNPYLEEGRLYGRGSSDMKGAIVSLLLGLEAIKNKPSKYDVSIMVTTDEELSQASQIRYLKQFLDPVKGVHVFSLDSYFGSVEIVGLGALQLDITVKGKSVHSGLSHLGVNAAEQAQPLIQALLNLKAMVIQRKSTVPVDSDTGLTHMEARLNVNMIHSGLKVNIVPDECTISIDRRLIPEENLADAEQEIITALSSVKGVEWEMHCILRIPTVPPCQDPMVDELAEVIRAVTGQTGKYGTMGSNPSDDVVCHDWQGQKFGLGVIRTESNVHGKDEFVYLKDVEDLGHIIALFLQEG